MKKLIVLFSLIFSVTTVFSQSLKPVKIDSLVTVSLPKIYTKKDTAGQQTFTARSLYGFIIVTRVANKNNAPLKKEKDLTKVFKTYVKDVAQLGNGTIQDERDTTVSNLKGHLFTLETDNADGSIQFRRFLFLYTQDVTYTFQFYYDKLRAEMVKDEFKAFFSSVKVSQHLQQNDQYLSKGGGTSVVKSISLYGGGLVVVLIVVFAARRRRKHKA